MKNLASKKIKKVSFWTVEELGLKPRAVAEPDPGLFERGGGGEGKLSFLC